MQEAFVYSFFILVFTSVAVFQLSDLHYFTTFKTIIIALYNKQAIYHNPLPETTSFTVNAFRGTKRPPQ